MLGFLKENKAGAAKKFQTSSDDQNARSEKNCRGNLVMNRTTVDESFFPAKHVKQKWFRDAWIFEGK